MSTAALPAIHPAGRVLRWSGDGLDVDIDLPGGNLLVDGLADGVLRVRQDRRDTAEWWFHWLFRLAGAPGRRVEVRFGDGAAVGARGPAVSRDGGRTWDWLDAQAGPRREAFVVSLPGDGAPLLLANGIPHRPADWTAFATAQSGLRNAILCRSRRGREVPLALAGGDGARALVLVTARHHCCEAMAGWALTGFAAAVAGDPAWARRATCVFVPFVDCDGSWEGDQGKNRQPRDHGRDYQGDSLYPETAAIRAAYAGWAAGRPQVVLDLHCPWISGEWNQHIYQVGAEEPAHARGQQRLAGLLEAAAAGGPLPYRASGDLPYGTAWNTGANYSGGKGLRRWAAEQPGCLLASSLEIPYADAGGVAVLPAGARAFGAALARATAEFLDRA